MQLNPGEFIGASIPQSFLGQWPSCNECREESHRTILICGGFGKLRKLPLCREHFDRALAEHSSLQSVEREYLLRSSRRVSKRKNRRWGNAVACLLLLIFTASAAAEGLASRSGRHKSRAPQHLNALMFHFRKTPGACEEHLPCLWQNPPENPMTSLAQ